MGALLNDLNVVVFFIISLVFGKTVMGYHFPWEKCECCGKKWREHKKQTPGGGSWGIRHEMSLP